MSHDTVGLMAIGVIAGLLLCPYFFWKHFLSASAYELSQFNGTYEKKDSWLGGGRTHRIVFFCVSLAVAIVSSVFSDLIKSDASDNMVIIALFIFFITTYVGIIFSVKRLHDIGVSGWYVIWSFIPFANFGLGVCLFFMPPQKSDNKFGPYVP